MQALQQQTEENATVIYPSLQGKTDTSSVPAESRLIETQEADEAQIQAAAMHATLASMFRLRREAQQRDRYEEISRAVERSQTPVTQALASDDSELRSTAARSVLGLSLTLKEVAEKKRRVEEIMEELLRETREARIRRRWKIVKKTLFALFLLAAYFRVGNHLFYYWWMVFPLSGLADRLAYRRREAARLLGEASEPRAVGVLAVALRDSDHAVRETAAQSLQHLLPRVRASDASFIDADQMNALLAIAYDAELDLKLPLLKALEQIGDARAIPAVREMQLYGSLEVRKQAEACLPFLLERERRSKESAMLLRAASANSASPDQLLRPATGRDATPTEQLLRSSAPQ